MTEMDFFSDSLPVPYTSAPAGFNVIDSYSPFNSVTGAGAAAAASSLEQLSEIHQQQLPNVSARSSVMANDKDIPDYKKIVGDIRRNQLKQKKTKPAAAVATAAAAKTPAKPKSAPAVAAAAGGGGKPTMTENELADSVLRHMPPGILDEPMVEESADSDSDADADDDHSHADSDSDDDDDEDEAQSEGEFIANKLVRIPVVASAAAAAAGTKKALPTSAAPATFRKNKKQQVAQSKRKDKDGLVPYQQGPIGNVVMHSLDLSSFRDNSELSTFVKAQAMMQQNSLQMMQQNSLQVTKNSSAIGELAVGMVVFKEIVTQGFQETRAAIQDLDKRSDERYQILDKRLQMIENGRVTALEDQIANADIGPAYLRTLWLTGSLCIFVRSTLDEVMGTPEQMKREAGMDVQVSMSREMREAHRSSPNMIVNALILGRPRGMDYDIVGRLREDRRTAVKNTTARWRNIFNCEEFERGKLCVIWVDHMDDDFTDYTKAVNDVVETFTVFDGSTGGDSDDGTGSRKRGRPRRSGSSKFIHMTNIDSKVPSKELLPLSNRTVVPVPSISALCRLKVGSVSVVAKARVALCRVGVLHAGNFVANEIDKTESAIKQLNGMGIFNLNQTTTYQAADAKVPTVVRVWYGMADTNRQQIYITGLHNILEHLVFSFAQIRQQDIVSGSDAKSFAPKNTGLPVCAYVLQTEDGRRCLRPIKGTAFHKLYHKKISVNELMTGEAVLPQPRVEEMPPASDLDLYDEMLADALIVRNEEVMRLAAESAGADGGAGGGAAGGLGNVGRGANGKFVSKKLTGSKRPAPEPSAQDDDDDAGTIPPPPPAKRQKVRSAERSLSEEEVTDMRAMEDEEQQEEDEEQQEEDEEEEAEEEEEVTASQRPAAAASKKGKAAAAKKAAAARKRGGAAAGNKSKASQTAQKTPRGSAAGGGAKKLGGRRRG